MRTGDRAGVVLRVLAEGHSEGEDSNEYTDPCELDLAWPGLYGISSRDGSKVKLGGVAGSHVGKLKSKVTSAARVDIVANQSRGLLL